MHAKYTEYLRDLMINDQVKAKLDLALSTYPLHTPKKIQDLIPTREDLNKKILNHYKYREIGFETVGRFLDELEITMCEIMPYYNERFKTIETMAEIENPFDTVDLVETFTQSSSGETKNEGTAKNTNTGSSSSNQKTNGKNLDSDTPQDSLSIGTKDIDSVDYASSAGWNESIGEGSAQHSESIDSESNGKTTSTNTTEHTYTKKGAQGVTTFGHDMIEFRNSIIDVMNEIVTDERLNELFMIVY